MDITSSDLDNIVKVKEIIQFLEGEINQFKKRAHLDDYELGALDEVRRIKRIVEKMKEGK